jgi:NADH/NAD ratio-sensing transcriptional regulator Rex
MDVNDLPRVVDIIASRSCPFKCTFCYHPLGNKYRQRSLDNVFKEIDFLKEKYNITFINVIDELFSSDEERFCEFANRIKKYNVKWTTSCRVNDVNEHILKMLKDSNIEFLIFGVESLSDTVLKSMKKRITKAEIEQAYKICDKVGVRPAGNIIIGDISETEDTIKESLNWRENHPEYDISVMFLLAIPNSEIWKYALNSGLINNKLNFIKNRFPIINLTSIDNKRFLKIKKDIKIDNIKKKYIIYGKLISSEKTENFYQNQQIFNFNVKCPICSMVSKYSYPKYSYYPFSIVFCKNCHKQLKISTKEAFKLSFLSELKCVLLLNLDIFHAVWLDEHIYWYKLKKSKFFLVLLGLFKKLKDLGG